MLDVRETPVDHTFYAPIVAAKRGKPSNFTLEQNEALRKAALHLMKIRGFTSQRELGDVLGIHQQSAGELLKKRPNFSYRTALKLVLSLGSFAGVEDYFRHENVMTMAEDMKARLPSNECEAASRDAIAYGLDADVIAKVNDARRGEMHSRLVWMTYYIDEQRVQNPDLLGKIEREARERQAAAQSPTPKPPKSKRRVA